MSGVPMGKAFISSAFGTGGGVLAKMSGFYLMDTWEGLAMKLALLGAMLASNSIGMWMHMRALAASENTLPVIVAVSGFNFCLSAILGVLLFAETVSLTWCFGAFIILLGLILVSRSQDDDTSERLKSD
ncbi:hypothetical protein QAD02_006148 [Eretmocerus hayati]|uniref:Uncharacterized protein n=1 Tax=Eretmocerus hayati TaxID=131215 RepID=A0ACC2N0W3_9HYME|nr:hypothetical protein QAD02_006148 [Eretmocerus hayati]